MVMVQSQASFLLKARDVAAFMGVSLSYLTIHFKKKTGYTLYGFFLAKSKIQFTHRSVFQNQSCL